jgi:hypothetical protein
VLALGPEASIAKVLEPNNAEVLIPFKMKMKMKMKLKIDTGELLVYHALCWVGLVRGSDL